MTYIRGGLGHHMGNLLSLVITVAHGKSYARVCVAGNTSTSFLLVLLRDPTSLASTDVRRSHGTLQYDVPELMTQRLAF